MLKQDVPVSAHGTVTADLTLDADAALGYYSITVDGERWTELGNGSFYVEEYKKPEYQVTVKPAVQRVLQGNSIQATIEARYFFGEPVAGAKVKYVVHTSQHYWWDEDQDDDSDGSRCRRSTTTPAIPTTRYGADRAAGARRRARRQRPADRYAAHAQSTASTTTRTTALKRA